MVDTLANFPGWTTRFEPSFNQEQSRLAGGRTRTKNFSDPLWFGEWTSVVLSVTDRDHWKAILESLELSGATFDGYALSRYRPIKHPASGPAVPGPLTINVVGGDNASLSLSGATGLKLRVGDMIQLKTADLYRVTTDSDNGATFSVTPQLWPGTVTTNAASVIRPYCAMTIVPGSVSSVADLLTGKGSISFQAIEARG